MAKLAPPTFKFLLIGIVIQIATSTNPNNQCPYFNLGLNSPEPNMINEGKYLPGFGPQEKHKLRTVVNSLEDFFYSKIDPLHPLFKSHIDIS